MLHFHSGTMKRTLASVYFVSGQDGNISSLTDDRGTRSVQGMQFPWMPTSFDIESTSRIQFNIIIFMCEVVDFVLIVEFKPALSYNGPMEHLSFMGILVTLRNHAFTNVQVLEYRFV